MDPNVLVGLLQVVALSVAPVVLMAAALRLRWFSAVARRLGTRIHVLRPPAPEPLGAPIEEIAATLRRLQPLVHHPGPGVRMAKYRGILAAYDGRLVDGAHALAVPTVLADLPEAGFDRDAERLRLEHALAEAGLVWEVRAG